MKRLLCLICAVMLAVSFSVTAWAKDTKYTDDDYGFTLTIPDGYTAINRSNLSSQTEFIERLGYSVKSFRTKMEESDMVLYAADKDNQHQIQVRVWTSDFSKEIKQLSSLDKGQLNDTLSLMAENVSAEDTKLIDSRTVKSGDVTYLTYTVQVENAFCYIENLTVIDGKCVALLYYNHSESFSSAESKEHQKLLASFEIESSSGNSWGSGYSMVIRIISALLVLAAAVVAVHIISGFIKDIKHRREQPEVIPDRIKMRRK